MFWKHEKEILENSVECEEVIKKINSEENQQSSTGIESNEKKHQIKSMNILFSENVPKIENIEQKFSFILHFSPQISSEFDNKDFYVHHKITGLAKKDKTQLQKIFPSALKIMEEKIFSGKIKTEIKPFLIVSNPLDFSACICCAFLVLFSDEKAEFLEKKRTCFDKKLIQKMFVLLQDFLPQCNPAKILKNEINKYFLTPSNFKD